LPEKRHRAFLSTLERVDLRESQVRADQPGLQLDGFLEEAGAVVESFLLESNGAEDRVRRGPSLRVSEGKPCLLIGLVEAALLNEQGRLLERVTSVRGEYRRGRKKPAQQHRARRCTESPHPTP
jgi:hypothetical protein